MKKEKINQYLFVLHELVGREIKRKYARSKLGIIWSVLSPLLSMAVISLVFSTMFKKTITNFPIYYLTGIIFWQLFTGATNSAMTAIMDNKVLLVKLKLPKQLFPLSRIFTSLINFGYSMVAYIVMLALFQIRPSITMVVFPLIVIFLLLFSMGIGYILSIVYVFFADIKYLYSILLTLWMYLTALFYPVESLSEMMRKIVGCNPVYICILAARECVMYGQWPKINLWFQMIFWGLGLFMLGLLVFKRNENRIMQKL